MKFHFYIPRNKQNMQAVQTMETVTKRFYLKSKKGYIEYGLRFVLLVSQKTGNGLYERKLDVPGFQR